MAEKICSCYQGIPGIFPPEIGGDPKCPVHGGLHASLLNVDWKGRQKDDTLIEGSLKLLDERDEARAEVKVLQREMKALREHLTSFRHHVWLHLNYPSAMNKTLVKEYLAKKI
jgi:hypothetical protein